MTEEREQQSTAPPVLPAVRPGAVSHWQSHAAIFSANDLPPIKKWDAKTIARALMPLSKTWEKYNVRVVPFTVVRLGVFFEALGTEISVCAAAEKAHFAPYQLYRLRMFVPTVAALWDAARTRAVQRLEQSCYTRATDGVQQPIVSKGKVVAHRKEYSDTLAIHLLSSLAPEQYGHKVNVEQRGVQVVYHLPDPAAATAADRARVVEALPGASETAAWSRGGRSLAAANAAPETDGQPAPPADEGDELPDLPSLTETADGLPRPQAAPQRRPAAGVAQQPPQQRRRN